MKSRLAAGLFFSAAFLAQYHFLCAPLWGYWGFSQAGLGQCLWLLPLMALPALALPEGPLATPSALFAALNYALLYAPTCVLLFHSTRTAEPTARLWAIWAGLALAAVVLGRAASPAPARGPGRARPAWLPPALPRPLLEALCWGAVLLAAFAAFRASRFHFVGLLHTSQARAAYSAEVGSLGGWFGYVDSWAYVALIPLLLSRALSRSAWIPALLLCLLCGGLFLLSGRKLELFCPAAVLAAHAAVRRGLGAAGALWALGLLLLVPLGLRGAGLSHAALVCSNVLNFRAFAVPQVLVPQYDFYYASHGVTLFRHVSVVNRLLFHGAPFEQPYHAVAAYYYHAAFTADAMPYATDGLAALGPAGVPLVALALVLAFRGLDWASRGLPALLVLPALMPFLFRLCDNSLFTALLTDGGLLLALLFALWPREP